MDAKNLKTRTANGCYVVALMWFLSALVMLVSDVELDLTLMLVTGAIAWLTVYTWRTRRRRRMLTGTV